MESSNLPSQPGCAACGHEHLVEFYETEEFLVATPEHRAAFHDALGGRGIDLEEAAQEGRYVAIDAAALLSTFMVDGSPDRERFQAAVTPLLDRAADGHRDVSVYGEMVALLWAAGDVGGRRRVGSIEETMLRDKACAVGAGRRRGV